MSPKINQILIIGSGWDPETSTPEGKESFICGQTEGKESTFIFHICGQGAFKKAFAKDLLGTTVAIQLERDEIA